MGPWYSKDCVYEEEVYIDTTNFTLGIWDYGEVPLLFHELSFNDL